MARGIVCGGQHTAGGDRTPPKYRRRQVTRRGTNIAEEITSLVSAENRPYIHMLNGLLVSARPPCTRAALLHGVCGRRVERRCPRRSKCGSGVCLRMRGAKHAGDAAGEVCADGV